MFTIVASSTTINWAIARTTSAHQRPERAGSGAGAAGGGAARTCVVVLMGAFRVRAREVPIRIGERSGRSELAISCIDGRNLTGVPAGPMMGGIATVTLWGVSEPSPGDPTKDHPCPPASVPAGCSPRPRWPWFSASPWASGCPGRSPPPRPSTSPPRWAGTGEVPWAQNRTKESANFILLWGEKSGTNPVSAPSPYNFDPDNILQPARDALLVLREHDAVHPGDGAARAVQDRSSSSPSTWNRTELDAWATGGSADGTVGVINIAPGAALPGSWGLAHELGHVFQNYTFLGRSGVGFTQRVGGHASGRPAPSSWRCRCYPDSGAGDLTRFLRTENLAYSLQPAPLRRLDARAVHRGQARRHRDVQPDLERGPQHRASAGDVPPDHRPHPGRSSTRRLAEYAQHQVTYDYSNRSHFMPFINNVYGAGLHQRVQRRARRGRQPGAPGTTRSPTRWRRPTTATTRSSWCRARPAR